MLPNSQFPADLVTFTEEIFSGKFHFLCSDIDERPKIQLINYQNEKCNISDLTLLYIMLKNGQTYFENLTVFIS